MERVFTLATAANWDPAGMLREHKIPSQRRPSAKKMSHFTFGDAIKGSFKNIFLLMMAKGGERERKGLLEVLFSFHMHARTHTLGPPMPSMLGSLKARKDGWERRKVNRMWSGSHATLPLYDQWWVCWKHAPRRYA